MSCKASFYAISCHYNMSSGHNAFAKVQKNLLFIYNKVYFKTNLTVKELYLPTSRVLFHETAYRILHNAYTNLYPFIYGIHTH